MLKICTPKFRCNTADFESAGIVIKRYYTVIRERMTSQHQYLLANKDDKMVKEIWSGLLDDCSEHIGGRLHPIEATRPNAPLDPFTE